MANDQRLLSESEAADYLGVSPRTTQKWRGSGEGPPFARLGRRAIRYRISDLEKFVEDRIRRSTSDRGEETR